MSKKQKQSYEEPNMVVENETIQDETTQAEELYGVTRNVAKDVLHIRKTEHANKQKILVIGNAMISQKEVLSQIIKVQHTNNETLANGFEQSMQTQENMIAGLEKICDELKPMQKAQESQQKIAQSLHALKAQHVQFMEHCGQSKEQQMAYMMELQSQVQALRQALADAAIAENFIGLDATLQAVMQTFDNYHNMRKQQHAILVQYMADTTESLTRFRADIAMQNEAVKRIEQQANANNDTVIGIDTKLNCILSQCEGKASATLPTLEEAFAPEQSTENMDDEQEQPVKKSMLKRLFGGK